METENVIHHDEISPSGNDFNSRNVILGLSAGMAASVLGGVIWFLIAKTTKIQVGYIAILVGVLVGFAISKFIKEKKNLLYGVIAGFLSLLGIFIGTVLIWFFAVPQWTRDELISSKYDVSVSYVNDISDDEIRQEYPFFDYLKDDLFESSGTHKPFLSVLFYALAVYAGFAQVYLERKPHSKNGPLTTELDPKKIKAKRILIGVIVGLLIFSLAVIFAMSSSRKTSSNSNTNIYYPSPFPTVDLDNITFPTRVLVTPFIR
jgi:hypothetical protein